MVHLTKIYTKTGDQGFTDLANKQRTLKTDLVIEAIGAVDEANSAIGMATEYYNDILEKVQNDLFDLGAELTGSNKIKINQERIDWLENVIDDYNEYLEPLRSFVLPTGPLHNARAVVRRAERRVWQVKNDQVLSDLIPKYLNRLSDLLFVMARYYNRDNEVLWNIPRN